MANPTVIYALIDPRTGRVRYIGKTNQKPQSRLRAHINERAKCHRCNWIAELKREGFEPQITVIEVCGRWPWQETERYWIRMFLLSGAKLTNNTSGGDGVPDLPPETRARMEKVWLGRKHTPETIAKLKSINLGRKVSKETKLKHSRAMKGRKITWTDKLAESIRKLDQPQVSAIQNRLRSGEKVMNLAKEFGLHRTTISKIKAGTYFDRYRKSK